VGTEASTAKPQRHEGDAAKSVLKLEVRATMDDGRRTMNDVTEAIARVLAGDVNAYAIIYSACNEALRAFVVRRHGYLGDDFINEVVIRTHEQALRNLNRYSSDKGASFQTWLNWQARSTAWRVEREWYSRRFVRFNPAVHAIQAVSAAGPVDLYEEKRLWQVLREETESLPEERRSILSHDFEARSHAENARSTGLTYEQVRYRRRLVLRRLRDRLCARGVRPVPVDSTPVPIWHGVAEEGQPHNWHREDRTQLDDDFTSSVTAVLPDGPDELVGADAKEAED